MEIKFNKYQGTGNDFIMIDDRKKKIKLSEFQIKYLCDRRFGVGADGVILIQQHKKHDFEMVYYNSDGSQSFCGNGSRCSIAFAKKLGMVSQKDTSFLAIDGVHEGKIEGSFYATHMGNVEEVEVKGKDLFVDTGSPHFIKWVEDIDKVDVPLEGKLIRNRKEYLEAGTNVNFATNDIGKIYVRTYERGVEDETLSCGTGVTAVALAASSINQKKGKLEQGLVTRGGELQVRFIAKEDGSFEDIWLVGPAEMVYEGKVEIS